MKTIRVVAAVIREGNKVFATARGYGEFKGQWEFPGGKIEEGETPQQAMVREIKEELEAGIEVGELIDTIEYDYPTFHLSMDCFWAKVVTGKMVLKEAEAAKWLSAMELNNVQWLLADLALIPQIRANLLVHGMFHRKETVEDINAKFIEQTWGIEIPDKDKLSVRKWCYSDVLYSFKSIYLLGMKAYYSELLEVCGLTMRPVERENAWKLAYSEDFLMKHIDKCGELNQCKELQEFISLYETKGNVIPIWPGGNVHKGQFWCYDNPDIYFNDPKIVGQAISFFETKDKSFMIGKKSVIGGAYKKLTIEKYVGMGEKAYRKYITHVVHVISGRNKLLAQIR